ncbi:hypothetical protein KUTeg_017365 [Tegillarca granosa]|uniref:Integrase core domain-containing protein n=1 Tax=Tegillarca granosa TaxID=220873 RepID=A0ABQ9EMD1_TEGGR|nr:hypothetical protein KUTeg_017365 [Tegillarca granosa]
MTFLAEDHSWFISERHLRRILNSLGLFRRRNKSYIIKVASFISRQLDLSGRQYGYRLMHLKCMLSGFVISRENVRVLLGILDPERVNLRKKRRLVRRRYFTSGPNQVWHIDSYDKLTPFGIGINGCIDGFARYIIWMEASYTNSDPKVIAGYFVGAILEKHGCPRTVRADKGTENGSVRQIQIHLRAEHDDSLAGERSFVYGKSTANTRIESLWGILRKQCVKFWIELFRSLQVDGYFDGYQLDKELIRFCFMKLIQAELDGNDTIAYGKPFVMYHQPQLFNPIDRLIPVTVQQVDNTQGMFRTKDELPCDEDVFILCRHIFQEMRWQYPKDANEARKLYIDLRQIVLLLI